MSFESNSMPRLNTRNVTTGNASFKETRVNHFLACLLIIVFLAHAKVHGGFVECQESIQEENADFEPFYHVGIGRVIWEGKFWRRSRTKPIGVVNSHKHLPLLRTEEVRKELELTNTQIRQIDDWCKNVSANSQELTRELTSGRSRSEVFPRLRKDQIEFDRLLNEILLANQMERLQQISNRVAIRKIGLITYLTTNVDGLERDSLERELRALSQQLALGESFISDSLSEMLEFLDEKRLAKIRAFRDSHMATAMDIDLFAAQTEAALTIEEDFGHSDSKLFDTLTAMSPYLQITTDGQMETHFGSCNLERYILTCLAPQESPIFLSDATLAKGTLLKQAYETQKQKFREERDTFMSANPLQKEVDRFNKSLWASEIEAARDFSDDFLAILDPRELDDFRSYVAFDQYPRHGVISLLLHGPLGRELGLNNSEKDELRKRAQQFLENTKSALTKLESRFIESLYDQLSENDRVAIEKSLGDKLVYLTPCVSDFR